MYKRGDTPVPGYTLSKFLGRGGYGEVWQATAPGGAPAAIKFVNLSGTQGLKEYRAVERIKAIRHANLLPIHAFWVLDRDGNLLDETALKDFSTGSKDNVVDTMVSPAGRPALLVMAMPLGDKNLSQRLAECRKEGIAGIPPKELLEALEDTARAIDYLNSPRHDLGDGPVAISHSDVKPQNIMLVGTSAQLCDFGLARVLGPNTTTTTGGGTPAYIPPEILSNRIPAPTSDQYSLAVSYIELRTGRLPFGDSGSYVEVFDAHLKGNLDFSALPEPEREVIQRGAALKPADRFPTCLEMIRALRAACPPDTLPTTPRLQDTQDITASVTPAPQAKSEKPSEPKTLPTPATTAVVIPAAVATPAAVVSPAPAPPAPSSPAPASPAAEAQPPRNLKRKLIEAIAGVVVGMAVVLVVRSFFKPKPLGTAVRLVNDSKEKGPEKTKDPGQTPPGKTEPKKVEPEKTPPKKTDPDKTEPKKVENPPAPATFKNTIGMTLVPIPAGEFTMGSPEGEPGHAPQEAEHPVQIKQPFYLGAHEVTQGQFKEVMGRNPSHYSADGPGRGHVGEIDAAELPVEKLSHAEAVAFCEQLSARAAEKDAGRKYRLPTEAEWEYACRAGTKTAYSSGETLLPRVAVCDFGAGSGIAPAKRPAPVGSLAANAWGLFDMHGNVSEWCSDWYTPTPAGGADPQGPAKGTERVLRGGGFYSKPSACRSADRYHVAPTTTDFSIGFRVVCEVK